MEPKTNIKSVLVVKSNSAFPLLPYNDSDKKKSTKSHMIFLQMVIQFAIGDLADFLI